MERTSGGNAEQRRSKRYGGIKGVLLVWRGEQPLKAVLPRIGESVCH
jgi:hypothetical protein